MTTGDEEFYRKHAAGLHAMTVALVGPIDADDIFSTAVLNCLRSRTWGGLDDDKKRGYLYRSVVNEARTWGRRAGRRQRLETLYAVRQHVPGGSEVQPEVWEAVASLSVRQRAVVFLTYWEDLDLRTVAKTLGISEGSVSQHLSRARARLKGRIDD